MSLTIYHNPRCSKSRQTLGLIEAAGQTADIILYLETPPSAEEIKSLLKKLGFDDPRALMRKGEAIYKVLGLKDEQNADVLIKAMAENPKLIERPIVVKGEKAILGRPPESVNALI
ncbi:MAG: arsenate reductase (glutaredoxin) [Maricaulaceae bacterium]